MKIFLQRNLIKTRIAWAIIATSLCTALALFLYSIIIPASNRIRGDASEYLFIANGFASLHDAIFYTGDRTYGFPLFLYLIKILISPINWDTWVIASSYFQFLLHIIASILFYLFFLKSFFDKAGLSKIAASFVTALLITYPTLVTYTTTPLTDTFCVDLLVLAFILYTAKQPVTHTFVSILNSILCGALLGYITMVKPSLLPLIILFYIVVIGEMAGRVKKQHSKKIKRVVIKTTIMLISTIIMIMPFLIQLPKVSHRVETAYHQSLQSGLSFIRVYWSLKYPTSLFAPGVQDPFLKQNYSSRCQVDSIGSLSICLISRPLAVPMYFGKKSIALFDVPHLQPYAVDITPIWFPILTKLFEVVAFCGFIALIISLFSRPFFRFTEPKINTEWIGLPWSIFVIALIFMQTLFHIEGRYGFPAIPFSLTSLFLGFAAARQAGKRFCIIWFSVIVISGVMFLYQIHAWDLIPPV